MVDYVLGSFRPEEKEIISTTLEKASRIVGAFLTGGYIKARDTVSDF